MPRPITLCTGSWFDLPLEDIARKAGEMGYHGLELACWGDHLDTERAAGEEGYGTSVTDLLERNDLQVHAICTHFVGQAVLDRIEARHERMLPSRVWGDGDPEGVNARAADELKRTARAAQQLGASVVNSFCGSSIGQPACTFPAPSRGEIDAAFALLAERFDPILDAFAECGVQFALEPHPASLVYDLYTAERALDALGRREEFGFNLDPTHLAWQGVDPAEFVRAFPDRIYHVHVKDIAIKLGGRASILNSHLPAGDPRRGWDYRSPGRGGVDFEDLIRALHQAKYAGPLSVECDDPQMDREASAREALQFVQTLDFAPASQPQRVAKD